MKRKDLLKIALLAAAAWLVLPAQAQDQGRMKGHAQDSFAYKAPLDIISQAGFYRVILTPEVLAKCNENLSDIRISHAGVWPGESGNVTAGTFIPYVLKTDFPTYHGESFIEFPILPVQKDDSVGDIRIGNWSGTAIDSLLLQISPSATIRNWTLSGSNDGQKWFAIREHIQVSFPSSGLPYHEMILAFPKSNYHYFKITQEDKGVLPLNIVRAGVVTKHTGVQRYRPVPSPVITQKDSSNHHSYINLNFPEPYLVEQVKVYIKSPRFFNRSAFLFDNEGEMNRASLILTPDNLTIDIDPVKSRSLLLDIDNEDNAPLVLDKVEASQKQRYLLTWLEPGKYELLAGDKHALAPKYDLRYFVDTVSREPAALMPGPLTPTNIPPLAPSKPPKDYKGVYLWAAIIVVLFLLIWLCLNMLKSIQHRQ